MRFKIKLVERISVVHVRADGYGRITFLHLHAVSQYSIEASNSGNHSAESDLRLA